MKFVGWAKNTALVRAEPIEVPCCDVGVSVSFRPGSDPVGHLSFTHNYLEPNQKRLELYMDESEIRNMLHKLQSMLDSIEQHHVEEHREERCAMPLLRERNKS